MQCCLAALMVLGFGLSLWTFEFVFIILFSIWFLVCLLLVDTCLGILSLKFFGSLNILLQHIWFSLFLYFLSLSLLVSTCLSMSLFSYILFYFVNLLTHFCCISFCFPYFVNLISFSFFTILPHPCCFCLVSLRSI